MTDTLTPRQRSALMAKVKSSGNAATELRLIAVFRVHGITGWRRGVTLRVTGRVKTNHLWSGPRPMGPSIVVFELLGGAKLDLKGRYSNVCPK